MSLINCPECGAKISNKANHCIKCGYVINASDKKKGGSGCLLWILLFILFCAIIGCFNNLAEESSTNMANNSVQTAK